MRKRATLLALVGALVLASVAESQVCVPAPDDLVGWWRGDGTAEDELGKHGGTPQGGLTYAPGKVGQAFSFDGIDSLVEVPDAYELDLDENTISPGFTIEFWVEVANCSVTAPMITKERPGVRDAYTVSLLGGNFIGRVNRETLVSGGPCTPGWHHVAFVWNGFYLDGTPVGGGGYRTPDLSTLPLFFGFREDAANQYFHGLLDEISIYERSLSAAEIQAIYNAGSAGKCDLNDAEPWLLASSNGTNKIIAYDASGNEIGVWGVVTQDAPNPAFIEFSPTGELFASYSRVHKVRHFAENGLDLGTALPLVFNSNPSGLDFDAAGNLYVAYANVGNVIRYSPSGALLGVFISGIQGSREIQFDSAGNLWVAERGPNRVRKFAPDGTDTGISATTGLAWPYGLALDDQDNLYVSNEAGLTIEKFDSSGGHLGVFASVPGNGAGLEFGPDGNLYLAVINKDIYRWQPDGTPLGVFALTHSAGYGYTPGLAFFAVDDGDGDGVLDTEDNCPAVSNPDQTDTDLDGAGDACDGDDDGDSILDGDDNCPTTCLGGCPGDPDQTDTDDDGFGDICDLDIDGDLICDGAVVTPPCTGSSDNCPFDSNPYQDDTDGDGAGDACDEDDDDDGICDTGEDGAACTAGPDNCPTSCPTSGCPGDPDQSDLDDDGIGDLCDADIDGDGICEGPDPVVGTCAEGDDNCPAASNPAQDDTDGDGDGDACDPDDDDDGVLDGPDNCQFVANAGQEDTDGDGVGDACNDADDQDGDEWSDTVDNCPAVPNSSQADLDGDLVGDACDPDIDGDGVVNSSDLCAGTLLGEIVNPANGCSVDQLCPCAGPRGTNQAWKNHGKYVSCVAHAAGSLVELGLISESEKEAMVSEAAQSSCGKKNK